MNSWEMDQILAKEIKALSFGRVPNVNAKLFFFLLSLIAWGHLAFTGPPFWKTIIQQFCQMQEIYEIRTVYILFLHFFSVKVTQGFTYKNNRFYELAFCKF